MRAAEFEADTTIQEVPRRWGVVNFRFTWTGFAGIDGDDVVAGDVFDGGFFIGDDDVLAIGAPEGYTIADATPTPDEISGGVAEWHGREDFDDGEPSVRASRTAAGSDTEAGGDSDNGTDGGPSDSVGDGAVLAVFVALLLTIGLVAGAYVVRSRRSKGDDESNNAPGTGSASGAATNDEEAPAPRDVDPSMEASSGRSAETGEGGSGTDADATDPGLLTDGDRVRRTLQNEGGRMRQSAIVEELDWSKSKTSRVLSRMADEGDVEKLRIGRENVIDLVETE